MKKYIALLGMVLFLTAGQASAATVNTASCDVTPPAVPDLCVTGVDGVIINGTTYNVEFVFDTFSNLNVGDNFPFYPTYGGPGDASVAVDAINLVINTSGIDVQRILASGSSTAFQYYEVVKQPSAGAFQNTSRGIINYLSGPQFVLASGVVANEGAAPHAVFTVVPLPAAVWLFGSALAGLGWLRRKPA